MSKVIHGAYLRDKKLYAVWNMMIQRCENPKNKRFSSYGGRGIKVCDAWHDPNIFMDWADITGYDSGLQLDRVDNNGNYEPRNCRWATRKENTRHTRRTKTLTLIGQTKSVAEWCESLNISEFTIYSWIRRFGQKECERRVYKRLAETS